MDVKVVILVLCELFSLILILCNFIHIEFDGGKNVCVSFSGYFEVSGM